MKYTQEQLEQAFDLVADKKHWKNPINAVIPLESDQALIREAVIHFTGSVPTFVRTSKGIKVTANGYYLTIGS